MTDGSKHLDKTGFSSLNAALLQHADRNHGANKEYTYEIGTIERSSDIESAVRQYFSWTPIESLTLERLEDWQGVLNQHMEMWIFRTGNAWREPLFKIPFLAPRSGPKPLSRHNQAALENLMKELSENVRAINVYQVKIKTEKWYEAAYDDFLIEEEDRIAYLHFGVTD